VESLKLKFQTVAEKTAKNFKGLLHFAAPGRSTELLSTFKRSLTTELFDVAYRKREHSA